MRTHLLSLAFVAACGFTVCADEPAKPQAASDYQDLVFLAEGRPLLIRAYVQLEGKSFRSAWDGYVDRVMKFLDKDGDGVLSKPEIEKIPPTQFLTGSGIGVGRYVIESGKSDPAPGLDANKDGEATRDELAAFLRKGGAQPFQFQMGGGGLSPYGVRLINLGSESPVGAEAINESLFKLLDKNRDGILSKDELASTPEVLMAKDSNDDEMITPRELVPVRGDSMYGLSKEIQQAAAVRGRPLPTASNDGPVILIHPGESGANLAKKLLTHYGTKPGQPAKKKLSATDVGMDKTAFDLLDADKDGSLDSEELAHFAKRLPDVEITAKVGKANSIEGKVVTKGVPELKIAKTETGLTLELGVTRIQLVPGAQRDNANFNFNFRLRDQYVSQFKMADMDNNNYLDEKESKQNPLFSNIFKALDTDGDGMLYEKEMVAYLDKLEELQKAVREGCVTMTLNDKGSGLFELIDANRDNRLSVREMRNAVELIKSLDRNGDANLARTEVPRNFEARVRPGPSGGADFGAVVVVARAGFDLNASQAKDTGPGPKWFKKMDNNRDGDVSRREFLGTDEDFKRIDADSDGLITAQEAEAIKK